MRTSFVFLGSILLIFLLTPFVSGEDSFDSYLIAKSDSQKYNSIAFDDGKVAWIEYGTGIYDDFGKFPRSIYHYDVMTGRKELVLSDTSWKRDLEISGDRYVWSDGRGIFVYDDTQSLLTFLYSSGDQYGPCIDGDTILWVEKRGRNYSVAAYNISSGKHATVTSSSASLDNLAISGDRVVYRERKNGNDDIMLLNMTTGEETVLCNATGTQSMVAIDGDGVVWADGRGGPYQIYLYDLKIGKSWPVNRSDSFQMYPDISGDMIVWEDYRNSSVENSFSDERIGDIRLFDRKENATKIVAEGQFKKEFPRVSDGYVVWADGHNDAHDIFLFSFLGEGRDFLKGDEGSNYSVTPTPLPAPDTKVRYYSTISEGDIEWYSLEPLTGDSQLSFELRWKNTDSSLSLSLVSPGGSTWHFADTDDSQSDQAVRMTISGVNGGYLEPGKWVVAVSGDSVKGSVPYDLCWY